MNQVDVLIIGAGPAGSTAALLLAKAGWSVAVFERADFPRRKVCGEYLSSTNLSLFRELGLLEEFIELAGPEVRRVGLFAGSQVITARMPTPTSSEMKWGRALRRELLDTLILSRAKEAGVEVWQPWSVIDVKRNGAGFVCEATSRVNDESARLEARVVIAAHGSWEQGTLPTQGDRKPAGAYDLLGFKAHFDNAQLGSDLMPMLVFPGGYGGMVNCDDGVTSLSCCVRRDSLEQMRRRSPHARAGEAVGAHIIEHCRGVREALAHSTVKDEWLSAGPIRPGIRSRHTEGIFVVGNAAGESHPIIAEGISMAMQSAWLLARTLTRRQPHSLNENELQAAAHEYNEAWLHAFRLRIKAADTFALLSLSIGTHKFLHPAMRTFPSLLTLGARLSGKVNELG